jgi:signal transduction histidine kinase
MRRAFVTGEGKVQDNIVTEYGPGLSLVHGETHRPSVSDRTGHVVQFYSEDSFLLDELSRFIGTALGAGDSAIVIATKAHRDGLSYRLRVRGFDPVTAIETGRYVPLDAAETLAKFMVDGSPDPARFRDVIGAVIARATAAAEGDPLRLVAFGEMVALLWADGKSQAAIELEDLWNDLAGRYAFSLRCAYPLSGFNRTEHADALLKICAQHSLVIPEESYTGLKQEDDRLRAIAELQQKARALETEMAERVRFQQALLASQEALRRSHEELENKVEERTQELIAAQQALRDLSTRLLNLRDEERRRLARELHDSTGQTLAAIQLNLAMVQNTALYTESQRAQKLEEAIVLADQASKELRTLSYLLHPPMLDEAGLLIALEWYATGFSDRCKIKVTLDLPANLRRLPQGLELAIFRVAQEALSNVYRHAAAKNAFVHLTAAADRIELVIEDDGKGMSNDALQSKAGVGISGMKERTRQFGGKLELMSSQQGTQLRVTFPLKRGSTKA